MTEPKATHTDTPATDRRALLAGIGGLAAGAFIVGKANAGPLNPPAGPIGPTTGPEPRTALSQTNTPGNASALFRITQPGSYYLTGNLSGQTGKHGIEIAASGVTIDLMGFDLIGVPGSLNGIRTGAVNLRGLTVTNGTVRNWGQTGINLSDDTRSGRIDGVHVIGNSGVGLVAARGFVVTNCTASGNATTGIFVNSGGAMLSCAAIANSGSGIVTGLGVSVMNCSASENGGTGFALNSSCVIADCTSFLNAVHGIQLSDASTAARNACQANGNGVNGAGIRILSSNNRVEDNNLVENSYGVQCTAAGNFIVRNTCSGNSDNWSVSANNICLVVSAAVAGAISGNSGGVSPGSTNPNANYTY
jgi:hypothetical protein